MVAIANPLPTDASHAGHDAFIAADVGGTHVRIGLVQAGSPLQVLAYSKFRCADYAIFGSELLSTAALAAMANRQGCLLANHGLLVAGRDLDEALALAIELEELCEQYWRACQLGQPVLLSTDEMAAVLEKFAGYGQQ